MVDIYLLQQLSRPLKTKFETAYEKHMSEHTELKELVDSYELDQHISIAVKFLMTDQRLLPTFKKMNEKLAKVDPDQNFSEELAQFFQLDEGLLDEIYEIGINKFKEEDYAVSLGCFVLLSSLDSLNEDYWYNEGIVAQKCGNYALALKAYSSALALDPNLIGALLFSAQCYLEKGLLEKASEALESAQNLENEGWETLISTLQAQLN